MKSMKKFILVATAMMLTVSFANAQFGIQGGYDLSTHTNKNISLNGFHIGPVYNLSIQGPVSLQYGLLYNYLTKKSEKTVLGVKKTGVITAHRLDLPLRVVASLPFDDGLSLFVFGGPNFNWAFSEIRTGTFDLWGLAEISGEHNIYKSKIDDKKKQFSPFDLQLGVGGGIQFKNIGVRVSYDWGMLDRDNSKSEIWKNNDLKASLLFYL